MKLIEKLLDDRFVALEKYPLPDPFRGHQTRFVKRGQVSRHRGLRHATTRVDLPRANAIRERELLLAEVGFGLLEPRENLASDRVGQGLVNGVDIHENGCRNTQNRDVPKYIS
jgi:hypothetical protein